MQSHAAHSFSVTFSEDEHDDESMNDTLPNPPLTPERAPRAQISVTDLAMTR